MVSTFDSTPRLRLLIASMNTIFSVYLNGLREAKNVLSTGSLLCWWTLQAKSLLLQSKLNEFPGQDSSPMLDLSLLFMITNIEQSSLCWQEPEAKPSGTWPF